MQHLSLIVLIGKTGSGKTKLLRNLEREHYQILDLERMAFHNGSVFGTPQRRRNNLDHKEILKEIMIKYSLFDLEMPVIMEWKGSKLGSFKIPDFLFSQMITAPKIAIKRDRESRIAELMNNYNHLDIKALYKALFSLRSSLDPAEFTSALRALKERKKANFVELILQYYDQSPEYLLSEKNVVKEIEWTSKTKDQVLDELKFFIDKSNA